MISSRPHMDFQEKNLNFSFGFIFRKTHILLKIGPTETGKRTGKSQLISMKNIAGSITVINRIQKCNFVGTILHCCSQTPAAKALHWIKSV